MEQLNVGLLGSRILVEQEEAAQKSEGGILLTTSLNDANFRGKVMATGPGRLLETGFHHTMTVKVGDTVVFESGTEVKVKDKTYVVLHEKDVLLILR